MPRPAASPRRAPKRRQPGHLAFVFRPLRLRWYDGEVAAIEAKDIYKAFGQASVLEGVDLSVDAGQRLGLIGPAAAGKTVLLKLLAGLDRPDRGSVAVGDKDLASLSEAEIMPIRRRIGMAFQSYALFDFMTVGENVAFPLARAGELDDDTIRARASERLRQVGLAGSEDKMPSELSGGMKKRVGIARATVTEPEILIYDEPTAGLDPVTSAKIYELLAGIQAETGGAVIAVSSDVEPLIEFSDTVAMLYDGRVAYHGAADEIYDAEQALVRQFVRGDLEGPL